MELAIEIWNRHIEVFENFDLICHNGNSLEDETKSNALFNALVTLDYIKNSRVYDNNVVEKAIDYLKNSKYYSDLNNDNDY